VHELVVLANRLPVSYDDRVGWRRSPGGLVTALAPVVRARRATWVGWAERSITEVCPGVDHPVVQLPFTAQDRQHYYNGLCNRTLWPALHGFPQLVEFDARWWTAYQRCNHLAASVLAELAADQAQVWIHDYHFALVPRLLRDARRDVAIGVFLHTPVALAEWGMPIVAELADALAAADVIGVQTTRDARALSTLFEEHMCRPAHRAEIVVDPISIDVGEMEALRRDPVVVARAATLRRDNAGNVLFVGADRLDYTKGIPERLQGLELLLGSGAVAAEELHFVQIASPSRADVPIYRSLARDVRRLSERVNRQFRRRDGRPVVRLIEDHVPRRLVAGHLLAADVALVTPRRDGMNLVAKEFAFLAEDRDAALVLGRGAGAAEQLGTAATLVDGSDPHSIAAGIASALAADPASRRARARQLAATVRCESGEQWAERFLCSLHTAVRRGTGPDSEPTGAARS
jgi:trehalose 6-phosphate synthase